MLLEMREKKKKKSVLYINIQSSCALGIMFRSDHLTLRKGVVLYNYALKRNIFLEETWRSSLQIKIK